MPVAQEEEVAAPVRVGSLSKITKAAVRQEEKEIKPVVQEKVDLAPVNAVQARDVLVSYSQELKKKGKRALAAYLADPMMEVADGTVQLTVASKTLERDIEEHWPQILVLLKKQKATAQLDIQVDAQKVQAYKLFTPQEQFDALCKEYPKLRNFKEQFGLDLEL